jgi:hypothetical protein
MSASWAPGESPPPRTLNCAAGQSGTYTQSLTCAFTSKRLESLNTWFTLGYSKRAGACTRLDYWVVEVC